MTTVASTPVTTRRVLTGVLVGLTCLLTLLSVVAMWLRTLVLDTDAYVRAVTPVLSHAAVRDALAEKIVDELYAHVDVAAALRDSLPRQAAPFAPTLAASIRSTSVQLAADALATSQVRTAWKEANRLAHDQLVRILEGRGRILLTANGVVAIDTSRIAGDVRQALAANGIHVFDNVPTGALDGQFVLFHSNDLARAQLAARVLDDIGIGLPIATIAAGTGAILCSTRRRRTAEYLAVGVAAVMVVVTVGIAIGRAYYLHAVGHTIAPVVAAAPFDALVVPLRAGVRAAFVLALLAWAVLWFTGAETVVAREHELHADVFAFIARHARRLAIGAAVVAAAVLVAWDRPRPALVVGVLVVLGAWELLCRDRRPPVTPTGDVAPVSLRRSPEAGEASCPSYARTRGRYRARRCC